MGTEAQIKNECTKYGQVTSMYLSGGEKSDNGWALITFATADMASHALKTLQSQQSISLSSTKLEIRYADHDEQDHDPRKLRTEDKSNRSRSRDRSRKKDKK